MIRTKDGTMVETFREKETLHKNERRDGKGAHGDFIRRRKHSIPTLRWKGKYRSLRSAMRQHLSNNNLKTGKEND